MVIIEDLIIRPNRMATTANKINLHVKPGAIVFVTGGSATGKTTLIKLLLGIETIEQGRIHIDGHELRTLSAKKRAQLRNHFGVISPTIGLLKHKTSFENISLALKIQCRYPRKQIISMTDYIITKLALESHQNKFVSQLSSSEQQKVLIARALVTKPKIILADDPTQYLDYESAKQFYSLLEEHSAEGASVIVATSDLSKIASLKFPIINLPGTFS